MQRHKISTFEETEKVDHTETLHKIMQEAEMIVQKEEEERRKREVYKRAHLLKLRKDPFYIKGVKMMKLRKERERGKQL